MKLLAFCVPGPGGNPVCITPPANVPSGGFTNGEANTVLQNGIADALVSIILLALFFLIFGGIKWITSVGDKGKVESARKTITFAIIGMLLALMAFFIVTVIGAVFGVQLIN